MLARLEIRDFALIRETHLDLAPGLNVVTGATGVGKTLVLAALELLLGARARADRLGPEGRATVTGLFELGPELSGELGELADAPVDDGELLVRRTAEAGGRNRCSVNGGLATVGTLRAIGERLIDIHGQNEHQSLLRPAAQLEVLDRFGGHDDDRAAFAALREELRDASRRLEAVETGRRERAARLDHLEHVVGEIAGAELAPGELEELEAARRRLRDAERFREALATSGDRLYEGETAVVSELGAIRRRLEDVLDLAPSLEKVLETIEEARVGVEDAAFALRELSREAEDDPRRLEEIEDRIQRIRELCREHGPTVEDVLRTAEEGSEELERLRREEADEGGLRARVGELETKLSKAGAKLVAARLATGERLAKEVAPELADLGLTEARLGCVHLPPPEDAAPLEASGPTGPGRFRLTVATNPGAEPGPLGQVASGGELARIMLALKTRLARADRVPVLVFDEVDANVGGRLGAVVGAKMAALARHRQVLCVTHLPQIAAFADRHFRVRKSVDDTEAVTSVEPLEGEARIEELAEMLGGGSKESRAQAKALVEEADRRRSTAET
jgi:DNA repair protein RecN (Recombination protein N)